MSGETKPSILLFPSLSVIVLILTVIDNYGLLYILPSFMVLSIMVCLLIMI